MLLLLQQQAAGEGSNGLSLVDVDKTDFRTTLSLSLSGSMHAYTTQSLHIAFIQQYGTYSVLCTPIQQHG